MLEYEKIDYDTSGNKIRSEWFVLNSSTIKKAGRIGKNLTLFLIEKEHLWLTFENDYECLKFYAVIQILLNSKVPITRTEFSAMISDNLNTIDYAKTKTPLFVERL